MMEVKTLVLGASLNPQRYSYKAVVSLTKKGHGVIAFGLREGFLGSVKILTELPQESIDTVTMYLNPKRQEEYYVYLQNLKPRRVIFNPGTENFELISLLEKEGVICEIACTLVLLSIGSY